MILLLLSECNFNKDTKAVKSGYYIMEQATLGSQCVHISYEKLIYLIYQAVILQMKQMVHI